MQELPTPTGMSTFSAELITDSASSDANNPGRGNRIRGRDAATTAAPKRITTETKIRAVNGRRVTGIPLPLAD